MSANEEIALVWFRRDLRLDGNPAWAAATSERKAVVPIYVLDQRLLDGVGPYRRRQLIANLQALDYDMFEANGGRLLVRFGDPVKLIPEAARVLSAGAVYYNADVSPYAVRRDETVAKNLEVPLEPWYGSLVHAPGKVVTAKGALSKTFSAFHKAWLKTPWDEWPEPGDAMVYDDPGEALPFLDGAAPFFEGVGEANRRLQAFLERIDRYDDDRDLIGTGSTAQISADLRFGTLSPRAVVEAAGDETEGRKAFVRQLAWRDWFSHVLLDKPSMASESVQKKYRDIAWQNSPADISAWKGGFTGYPIVDAGMRQLRETGWMHNRVRMITASFLVKDLRVDWRIGEKHFRHLLVDADVAQNVGNWQWVAGTGLDASPYHRVMNPVTQSREFDPEGAYIRKWVPELAALDNETIHAPFEAGHVKLALEGIRFGRDYPEPIVDHAEAREEYLAMMKAASGEAPEKDDADDADAAS